MSCDIPVGSEETKLVLHHLVAAWDQLDPSECSIIRAPLLIRSTACSR